MKVKTLPPTSDLQSLTSFSYRQPMLLVSYISFRENICIYRQTKLYILFIPFFCTNGVKLCLCLFEFLFYTHSIGDLLCQYM